MMQFKLLNEQNCKYFEKIYYEAFPEYERINFKKLFPKSAYSDKVEIAVIQEEEQNVGLIMFVNLHQKAFILYLAIDSTIRGRGLGKKNASHITGKVSTWFYS